MDDTPIIRLFQERSETAIEQAREQYGKLCMSVARHILPDARDAEECVNDACLRAWNAIPPENPRSLSAYLVRITRNLALDRYAYNRAEKRNDTLETAFDELEETLSDTQLPEDALESAEFSDFLNAFLRKQPKDARVYFIRRYFYGESLQEVALVCKASEAKVKSALFRTRNRLREALQKEGIAI